MTVRDELVELIAEAKERDEGFAAYDFLRDHGAALVEALDAKADAERWREFRRMSVTVDQAALETFEEALPLGEITEADLDTAIDRARGGE